MKPKLTLDLHGVKHQDVELMLENFFLWENNIVSNIQGINVLPEIGDILRDLPTDRFYEVHNIVTLYTPLPNSSYNPTQISNCASSNLVIYELYCYQTRVSRLNLLPYKII